MTRQAGKEAVYKLVDDFEKNECQYMAKSFQETETRSRFIDPFFSALGWDFQQTGIARKFWDVHREYSQRDNSTTKKPDYAFRVREGSKYREKFFVEAKAPHVDLTGNLPVFQAKRYAFSSHGKTPIVILTDFQTFRVFNGLEKPVYENPLQGLIKGLDLEYHTYLDTWDTIWDGFSKEAVTAGSIEQLIGKVGRNTKSLDDEFLADISAWREMLARNAANRNKNLSADQINEAVQRILDRLIFIRNLEDRDIERENTLLSILNVKQDIFTHLIPLFRSFDIEYNGLLFKEHFSETIIIDDPTIKSIIKQLCPPHSPYEFDMIEPEILGRIYERFLGSKIRLTENHQAKVEQKPEVRHAGGVYYTPQYIVDYIVENTLGVKIQGKSPEEIEAIKICDPACGSGSFLLGAFHYLIEYHREWYTQNCSGKSAASHSVQKKYRGDFFSNADNEIQLTLKKKTEILKNNIFGVDIDREATEVAIMSLYLKILDEGYDRGQTELFMRGHILPEMTGNIKCGNSLIGTDYYIQGSLDLDDDTRNKVNCFDWDGKDGFEEIFKNGGMDVVIGNPPYVLAQTIDDKKQFFYLSQNYYSATYKIDTYQVFIEKALKISKAGGFIGYITPNTFLRNKHSINIRSIILKQSSIHNLRLFYYSVFSAAVDTLIICMEKSNVEDKKNIVEITKCSQLDKEPQIINFPQQEWLKNSNYEIEIIDNIRNVEIGKKMQSKSYTFGTFGTAYFGIQTYDREKYVSITKKSKEWKPIIDGKNIQNFFFDAPMEFVSCEKKAIKSGGNADVYNRERICTRQIGETPIATIIPAGIYTLNTVYNLYFTKETKYSLKFILGIMLSSAFRFYWKMKYFDEKKTFPKIKKDALLDMPIPVLNLSAEPEKSKHDNIVSLVDKMLELKQKEAADQSEKSKTAITRLIQAVDKEIDKKVYELYGLTEDEIKVVEG